MKSNTLLDSVVFRLTPTRTRCDLVVTANGKREKIASGLLNPFLAHLKVAQEQIGKGGYSVILQPDKSHDATWFTKGTVERFVRFVSTPEILERVYSIESEILQIEEAISFQKSNESVLDAVEIHQDKSKEINEGSKHLPIGNEEKAIVLYKPDLNSSETDGARKLENSKAQLLRVLETRRTALHKEQGMAFARAVAAGFDIDNLSLLMSFSRCFGASRMMEACSRFKDLWKAKHESGQWLEMEADEAVSCRDFSSMNSSGLVIPNMHDEQKELKKAWAQGGATSENNEPKAPESFASQFQHPMFPSWPIHPQAGQLPVFQQYPMPMPYYQNFTGGAPFWQQPCPSADYSTLHNGQKPIWRRHTVDNKECGIESEDGDIDAPRTRALNVNEHHSQEARKKCGKSKKQPDMVVIRNLNYIRSQKQNSSGNDSDSYASETDPEDRNVLVDESDVNSRNNLRYSKREGYYKESGDALKAIDDKYRVHAVDDGHWKAFQNFLLRNADDDISSAKTGMFAMEGTVQARKQQSVARDDPLVNGGRIFFEHLDDRISRHHDVTRDTTCMLKPVDDEALALCGNNHGHDVGSRDDVQLAETGVQRSTCRRKATEDLTIEGSQNLTDVWSSSLDPSIDNGFGANNQHRNSSQNMADESFIVPHRLSSLDQAGEYSRTAISMDSELPSAHTDRIEGQCSLEPNDLNLMPDRIMENQSGGYDPALDYQLQDLDKDANVAGEPKQGSKKLDKNQRFKAERRSAVTTRRGKPSKLSPSEEARARSERLRTFKADLQKQKKEKEQEQIKRIEALKMERQKRIASRSGAHITPPSHATKKQLLKKLSPSPHKGSKFSDTEPGSSSPLQRSTLRRIARVSSDSLKTSKPGRLENGSEVGGKRLTRSASALSQQKKETITPDPKETRERIRRLSEPKSSSHYASAVKTRSAELISKRIISDGPEVRNISSPASLDQKKSSALPELKMRTTNTPSVASQSRSKKKDRTLRMSGNKFSNASKCANMKEVNNRLSSQSDGDDNTVVDKTVVVLECEKPSIPVVHASEKNICIQDSLLEECHQQPKMEEDVAIHAYSSPTTVKFDRDAPNGQLREQSHVSEARSTLAETVLPKISGINVTEKPYQAPYAHISSTEDPCMMESEYMKAPLPSLETEACSKMSTEHVSDCQTKHLESIWEASGKPHGKESSKGLKRLLKLGRRKHGLTVGDWKVELDQASQDGSVADDITSHSGEVSTLKNLISQDNTSSAGTTPQKSSRSFSLFSPFRTKTGEKKLAY